MINLLNNYTRYELFLYASILIISLGISQNITMTTTSIFFLILAFRFSSLLHENKKEKITDNYEELDYRLEILGGLTGDMMHVDHFEYDPNLIDLFYNIKEFHTYNKDAFNKCIENVNTLMRIYASSKKGLWEGCYRNLSIAKDKYHNALNHLQSMIYRLPSVKKQVYTKKFEKAMKQLQIILIRHLETILTNCPKDKYPYSSWFLTGMKEPKEQYSESVLVPEKTVFDYF